MRDPINVKEIEYNGDSVKVIQFDQIPKFDVEDWDLMDDKDFKKYIDNLEKIIRTSYEYKAMVRYLRENMNMNQCTFYQNVNNIDTFKIKIELHHEPFTLHDLCNIVYNKRCYYGESLEENMVAKEVMYLHYKLMVGLVPLSETVHQLVHNGYLFVPATHVLGNFKEFVNEYWDFISPEVQEIYNRILEYTDHYIKDTSDLHVLDKKYIYLDVSGAYDFPTLNDIVNSMNDRINEIKESYNKPQKINPIVRVDKY